MPQVIGTCVTLIACFVCGQYSKMKFSYAIYVHSSTGLCDRERVDTLHSFVHHVAHAQWGRCRSAIAGSWHSLSIEIHWRGRVTWGKNYGIRNTCRFSFVRNVMLSSREKNKTYMRREFGGVGGGERKVVELLLILQFYVYGNCLKPCAPPMLGLLPRVTFVSQCPVHSGHIQ